MQVKQIMATHTEGAYNEPHIALIECSKHSGSVLRLLQPFGNAQTHPIHRHRVL